MAAEKKAIVISGDVVGSSYLKPGARKKLQHVLDIFIYESVQKWPDLEVEQYRGDSIQAILTSNRLAALRITLLLHSYLIQYAFKMRLAIGVGEISFRSKQVITSDGSAFQASGPYLDTLVKSGELISIAGNEEFTSEWQVHSSSLDYLIQHWSIQQAEAIYLQLQDLTQDAIAQKLKIKQPAVYYRLQGAGWSVVNKILTRFESVIPTV
ncbi:hypothetical protein FAM09_22570 [Niastella caeni]|uniref:Uncharacterized protein n=1 Tax=Niastella caeni TaxID=2569763 RepID=A0A4S8HIE7_9BACT|nr:hypothetical protein [Niastella caeni]THU34785.1 hypothetical protein FAM09_22570 [Niastella caeni]